VFERPDGVIFVNIGSFVAMLALASQRRSGVPRSSSAQGEKEHHSTLVLRTPAVPRWSATRKLAPKEPYRKRPGG
jgi:hypothetical protein